MKRNALGMAALLAGAMIASPAAAQGSCDREMLQGIADSWVSALEKGSPFEMKLGEWVDYRENMKLGSMSSFFDKPREVDWHLALLDTAACKVYVESVILDEERPMVLATQLSNGYFGVGPIDNIVTDEGDWLFNAQATHDYARQEDWSPIPEGQRMSREQLIAAADAYLDLFSDPNVEVPWGTPCARLEGGIYTAKGQPDDSCDVGVPEGVELKDRKYIVDEALGAVNVFLKFGEKDRPDSHTFRVENGKLRYIHTVTNCGDEVNCGLSSTPPAAG